MAKIKLGARPKHFPATVKVKMLNGDEVSVEMKFKYRTRSEFGAFLDEIFAENEVKPADNSEQAIVATLQNAYETGVARHADQIMRAAEGWNLDEEFSREKVIALCDEIPAAAFAIMETYRIAITEGRLGN
jgi:hypothetical protein